MRSCSSMHVLVGVAAVTLQLLLAGSAAWHHHEDASHDHSDECSVCLAVDMMGQATLGAPPAPAPAPVALVDEMPAPRVVSRSEPAAVARGPPATP